MQEAFALEMAEAADAQGMSAPDLASLLDVTPRRVRQLAEEGRAVAVARGRYDPGFSINEAKGAVWLGQDRREVEAAVVAAVGWLATFTALGEPIDADDRAAFCDGAARWMRDGAALLAMAGARMGPVAPAFVTARKAVQSGPAVSPLAAQLMLPDRRLGQLAEHGVTTVQGHVRFLPAAIAPGLHQLDYHAEKTRLVKSQADVAEIAAERARGNVLPADEVEQAWAAIVLEVRSNLLGGVAGRIAARVRGMAEETTIKRAVTDEIAIALRVLSTMDSATLGRSTDDVPDLT